LTTTSAPTTPSLVRNARDPVTRDSESSHAELVLEGDVVS